VRATAIQRAVALLEGRDVLVSYSGGKDSLIILDLAKRVGRRVEAFTMELVPGLAVVDRAIAWAETRYKLTIRRYPHWLRAVFAVNGRLPLPRGRLPDARDKRHLRGCA